MVDALLGRDITEETTIENEVKQSLKTTEIQSQDINEIISNTFQTNLNISSINKCGSSSVGSNTLSIRNLVIEFLVLR